MRIITNADVEKIFDSLRSKCDACYGLCCVALFFSKTDGFPHDKIAGQPCRYLAVDHQCDVYPELKQLGYKGCITFECFGAGQKISQSTFTNQDWRNTPSISKNMFDSFQVMRQLHEMIAYLAEAFLRSETISIHNKLSEILLELIETTNLSSDNLLKLSLLNLHNKVDTLLTKASELVLGDGKPLPKDTRKLGRSVDLIGKDLRQVDLKNSNLRSSLLIAANLQGIDFGSSNFLGADMRDALIMDANLSDVIFLTQAQINSAEGNSSTRLPKVLVRPNHWNE